MSEVDVGHELERLVGLARTDQLVGEAGLEPGRAVLFLKQERERTLGAFEALRLLARGDEQRGREKALGPSPCAPTLDSSQLQPPRRPPCAARSQDS